MRRLTQSGGLVGSLLLLMCCGVASGSAADGPLVERLEIRDTVQPITAGRLERAISIAERDHAAALLVDLDTPGGLLDSTREMVGAILASARTGDRVYRACGSAGWIGWILFA